MKTKILSLFMSALMLFSLLPASVLADDEAEDTSLSTATITIESGTVEAGESITLNVVMTNVQDFTNFEYQVMYDDETFTDITLSNTYTYTVTIAEIGYTYTATANCLQNTSPIINGSKITAGNAYAITLGDDGILFTITLTASENAYNGDYTISLAGTDGTEESRFIKNVVDAVENDVSVEYVSGIVTVTGGQESPDTVKVTGVTLDQNEAALTEGETLTLTATVEPEDATDPTVTWTSSDESVATVDASGTVTAVAAGTATITATAGSYSASCVVTVSAATVDVTGIALDQTAAELTEGETLMLTATVSPTDATDPSVTWTSSDESVATVDASGIVTAVAAGTATITAAAGDYSASCTVTVSAKTVDVTGIALDQTAAELTEGETLTLTATVSPTDATDPSVTWTSSNESVATVDANGTVTAVAAGTATITAAAGSYSTGCTVTVSAKTVDVTGIALDQTAAELTEGETLTLTATVSPTDATDPSVTWTSSDEGVATVDADGIVTAVAAGTATITATAGDYTATCTVTVNAATVDVTAIALDQTTAELTEGETLTLTATVSLTDATNPSVTWTSSDESVATVDANGIVTAVAAGTVTITATAGDYSATCEVTVTADDTVAVTNVTLDQTAAELTEGETLTLTATVSPTDATDPSVTWTSSDESIATVDENGIVTAVSAGTTTITATAGSYSASCTVTVSAKTIDVTSVTLDQTAAELTVGDTLTLTATVLPKNATDPTVTWKSGKASVATVDENGVVTALKAGTAVITATVGDYSATCTVTVTAKEVASTGAALNVESAMVAVGGAVPLTVSLEPADTTESVASTTFESSDESVATVDENGVVTGVAAGTATITATVTTDADAVYPLSCTVTVSDELAAADSASVETVESDEIEIDAQVSDVEQAVADYLNETYSTMTYKTTDEDGNETTEEVTGEWEVVSAGSDGTYTVMFTPDNTESYAAVYATVQATVARLTPTVEVDYETISASGKTLEDAALTLVSATCDGETVAGTLEWDLDETTEVTKGTYYGWTFTPDDTDTYETVTGTIRLWKSSSSGGSSSGGSSSGSSSSGSDSSSGSSSGSSTDTGTDYVSGFTDVTTGEYYSDAVAWAVENGVTTGTSDTTFSPNGSCTRAQVVTFLYRLAGEPDVDGEDEFADVSSDTYYYNAVIWAVQQGITNGVGNELFDPEATCTRAQIVTFLYRYANSPAAEGGSAFADVESGAYYEDAVAWAEQNDVTNSTSDTTFSPNNACTRAQIVTFLYRAFAE